MEKNQDTLKKALAKLPEYHPDEDIWAVLNQKLNELPLEKTLQQLPQYEPDKLLWELIIRKSVRRKPSAIWLYTAAAASLVLALLFGAGLFQKNTDKSVSYSLEKVDQRLQADASLVTNEKYEKLKAYCETETLVCNNKNYKRLQQEYEKLNAAAAQLQQAIGTYNTEPELIRQFSTVEEQKAEVLNEMAKMI